MLDQSRPGAAPGAPATPSGRGAEGAEDAGRFVATSAIGLTAVLAAGALFALALSLVVSQWPPLRAVDVGTVDALNSAVSARPLLVTVLHVITDLGGAEAAWLVVSVLVAFLLLRRLPRLAVWAAVTGLGALVLTSGTKALVDRVRPVVDVPVATAPDASFPSGHALGSTVTYGVLLLVLLPVVPRRSRRVVVAAAVGLVLAVGLTRIALGVHYPSDVLGGWALGVAWLGVTTAAFRRWHEREGLGAPALAEGLEPERRAQLQPAPAHDAPLPRGWAGAAELLVGAVLVWGGLVGVGLLVTDVLGGVVQPVDEAVVRWFVDLRSDGLTTVAVAVGYLGSTAGIIVLLLVALPVALALTRRWTPAVFLLVAVVGETALYVAASRLVGRTRPLAEQLSPTLPSEASFPSGHVAASAAAYGAIALLVRAWTGGRIATLVTVLAVLVPLAVALSRVYRGVHYPSDALASLVYVAVWLAVCWHVLQPARGTGAPAPERAGDRAEDRAEDRAGERA